MALRSVKLLSGALVLSLGLVACGDNAKMARRENSGSTTFVETESTLNAKSLVKANAIDGNYVSLQPKGHVDADGKEVIEGHILNYYTITNGKIYGHEIDLDKKTFTSFFNTYGTVASEDFSQIQMYVQILSCDENGNSLDAERDDMGFLENAFKPKIEVNERGLVLTLDGKKEAMLKISQEDADAIKVHLVEFESLSGEKNNCSKKAAKLDRAEESMDMVQEFLNQALAKN